MILNPLKLALFIAILGFGILTAALVVYEDRHPCLRYVTHRVLVPELTTYRDINGGFANSANGGFSIPVTTPEHYEDEVVCVARK